MADQRSEEISPWVVKAVENNLLLHQALDEIKRIRELQEINHRVATSLSEHETIDRVDTLWVAMGQLTFFAKISVGALTLIVAGVPILLVTHAIWHWPA